jgi:N-acetylglucosaminyl-diphospho-decaprenol L-rhamnosyltransferase
VAVNPVPDQSASLAVAIVAWRTADLTIDALRSIAETEADNADRWFRVYVVDNDSGDGTADRIEQAIQEQGWSWATLIRAERNGGFAYGNNQAIRAALADFPALRYVLLLNPDTLVRPAAFRILVDFLDAHPKVGIAGGRSEDPDATPQFCCFSFLTLPSELGTYLRLGIVDRLLGRWATVVGIPEQPTRVGWVSGAHMMIRREVIDAVGLMDESYFLYFEETDYTLRAARAGWECWHVPASRIVHLVGQSSGVTLRDGKPRRLPKYWFESRRRYFVLNHGRLYAALTDIVVLAAYGVWRLRRRLQRKPDTDPPHFAGDLLRYGALLNGRGSMEPRRTGL